MQHRYRLLLFLFLLLGLSSKAQAQTYTFADYLVRTIPSDFVDISGIGTDVSSHSQQYDWYYRVNPNEITIPFNFRWLNTVSNKIKITSQGSIILGGEAEVPADKQQLYADYYDYYWYYIPYSYGSGYPYQYGANNMLSAWTGLHYASAESKVHYAVLGTAPNRRVVVQASKYTDPYVAGSLGSSQVVLFESGISRWEAHFRADANTTWGYPYGSFYGPHVGATGWTTPNFTTYAGVRSYGINTSTGMIYITSHPNVVGVTPGVGYGPYPQSQYNVQMPTTGYRFFIAYPYDLAASLITNPTFEQILNKDVAFTPTGVITNEGSSAPSTATIRRRITLFGTGEVYNQSINIAPPAAFTSTNVSFPQFTPTQYGIYYDTMEVVSTSPADQVVTNNRTVTQYVVSPPNNIKAITVTNPAPNSRTPINIPTPVGARFRNLGANAQINVPVSMVIYDPAGQVIYRDTVRFPQMASGETRDTSFREWTPTSHGSFRFCAIAILANDQLRADDSSCSVANVRYETDVAANFIVQPEADQENPEKKVFRIFGSFQSVGVADLFDIPARVQIRRCSDNQVVFQADSIIPELNVDAGNVRFGFPTRTANGQFDVTKLAPGCYTACVIARYSTDGDRTNDTACTSFSIIPQLSGNIEVGKGRRFPTIPAAIDSMRFRGVGGNLTLILTDSYYRVDDVNAARSLHGLLDFSGIIGTGENVRVTWKPKAGVTPRIALYGDAPHGFYFGAGSPSYMTFDGMSQLSPSPERMVADPLKRNMTIVDSSNRAGGLFAFEHGFSHHITLKNMKLIGDGRMTNDSSSVIRLYNERSLETFLFNRITDTMPAHHITIENNEIGNARYGIYDRGLQPLFSVGPAEFFDRRNHSNVFTRNTIGTSANPLGRAGIAFENEDNLMISMNEISNVNANLAGGGIGAGVMQIGTGNVTGTAVSGNKIHNITGVSQTLGIQFTQNATVYSQGTGPNTKRSTLPMMTNNRTANNMVYDLRGTGTVVPVSYSTMATSYWTAGDSVYHNSISTRNAMYNVYMAQSKSPFVMNNVIQNTNTGGGAVANYYFEVPRPFLGRVKSDYNLFDLRNSSRFATVVERDEATGNLIQTRHFRRLNDWRTFTEQDVHSVTGDPRFVSDSLHLPGALSYTPTAASNNGIWLGSGLQLRDIDGDLRQMGNQTPDIGADEVEGFELTNDLAVMAIYKPAGYSSTSDTTFVVTENPLAVQALVKNLSQSALYNRSVTARLEVALNGGSWQQIWSQTKSGLTFDLNESKIVDFQGPVVTQQQEQQGVFRVTVTVADDQNNPNNMEQKLFRVMIKRQAVLVSYDPTTARGTANKDSATAALRRLGVAYDSLNRASFSTVDIDYTPWWTVVYTVGDASTAASGGLSFKQTEELTRYLNAGRTYAKKSLVISGQNIAFYNDQSQINGNGVTDREFTRQYMHARYVAQSPVSGSYADTIDGQQVYFQFREYLSATTPDVVTKTVTTAPVGSEVSGTAYTYRKHALTPSDSAAGTTWSGTTYNVVFFAFDLADVKQSTPAGERGILTSGATRVMRGALDFIQSFRGTVLPVNFVDVDVTALTEGNQITWKVAEQKDVARFEVESLSNDATGNGAWSTVGTVGSTKYSFTDANVTDNGLYTYRVVAVDLDGSRTVSMTRSIMRTSEKGFVLEQNYPNPFNPSTVIAFTLAEPAMVTINVLDVTGKVVATVAAEQYGMGTHPVQFDASNLTSGTYVYEMTAVTASGETIKLSRKMTLSK